MKESLGSLAGRQQLSSRGPWAVSGEGDRVGVAAESRDIVLHPGERRDDILEAVVTGRDVVSGAEETYRHASLN